MTVNLLKLLILGAGGFAGTIARYLTVAAVDRRLNAVFPYGTWCVNLLGSFLIGVVYILAARKLGISDNARLFLGPGFCGGFTTFSAFAWENMNLIEQRLTGTAVLYICVSLVGGLLAVWAGAALGRQL